MFPVFLDTCVLLRPYLCDTLLSIAEAGVYRPLWSPTVMTELERNLARRGLDEVLVTENLHNFQSTLSACTTSKSSPKTLSCSTR
jgi:PIN domain